MDRVIRTPCWVRGGRLDEIAWIGKEVLAWCTGLYIVFFHVLEGRQALRWCWGQATGDGARCITGHVAAPIFAFCERSPRSRILVHAYPAMTRVSECVRGCDSGYLAIAFTAHDHLVSLGSYPDFSMTVWCWRTGGKIAVVDTTVRDEVGQIIRVTPSGRAAIGQMGKTCGRLVVWELDVVGEVVILKDHEVRLPMEAAVQGIDWCPTSSEPLLAITDRDGHIYLSNYDGSDVRRIVLSQRCGICVAVELPAVCWFRGGIVLRTTFCQIRYFTRDPRTDVWRKQWYVKSIQKPYVLVAHPFRNDWLFYYTLEGYLMQIIFAADEGIAPSIRRHLHHGGSYRFVDFLRPWCHHLAVTDDLRTMSLLECLGGSEIARVELDMNGAITDQASHPDEPLIVVVSDRGEMTIVAITEPEQPTILARLHLQRKPLDLVRFSQSGRSLIAARKETGDCYCVDLRRDGPWRVTAQLRAGGRLADAVLYDDDGTLRVLALRVEHERYPVGSRCLVYDVSRTDRTARDVVVAGATVALPGLYRELCHAPVDGELPELLLLIGAPYHERRLHALRLERSEFKDATLTDAAPTGHHTRPARVHADRRWIITCAHDGLVVARDRRIREIAIAAPAHHRLDAGSRKAIVSPDGDTIIALGHDGSLVAVRLHREGNKMRESVTSTSAFETDHVYPVDRELYELRKERILADYAGLDPAIRVSLTRATQEFPENDVGYTWEEWRYDEQLHEEMEFYAAERAAVRTELTALRANVGELLDANETRPEIERLPVSAFDLDRVGRDQRLKAAKDEREDVRMELEHLCASMDRVTGWLKTTFWDPQIVPGRSIFSLRGDTEVTSYPLREEEPRFRDQLRWAQFARDAERRIIEDDTFQPWHRYTDEQLRIELSKPARVHREDERHRMDVLLEEEEIDREELAELRALDGMTTHRFVEQSPYYYSQMESYGFAHVTLDDYYLMHDCGKLRAHFNELFDDMYSAKEREISAIRERNERIRHIDSELRIMFGQSVPRLPVDPQWHPKEKVENVIRVLDHEVKARPYVSPSQQDLLDRQAAEAERARQLLLADDFRERALTRMMDGVLEVRWEDTIKVDVRKPACMLEKQPEQYTAEDVAAVRRYEADAEVLRQERERYKRILEADYARISAQLQEGIDKFDAKLSEFFQLKLRVEAAINQLKLRHVRGRMRNQARIASLREDDRIKREMSEKRRYTTALEEHAQRLHDVYQDMLAQHDALCGHERTMAKRSQHEFAAVQLTKTNVKTLEQQYRRRPRVSLKNVAASDLIGLAQQLATNVAPVYQPAECADYLKSLESLDARPGGLPHSIDAAHWDQLTRSRREKIEMELRIRAQQLEIAAAERAIAFLDGRIDVCKSSASLLRDELRRTREERMTREQDAEVQLVLRAGQVEIELRGERRDAANAVLVPRDEIVRVNEHILAAGARKLDALKRTIDFRHGTLSIEWEHRCLRTRFEDLEEDLRSLRDVVVTREMRVYLKRRAKGLRDDKTAVRLEREIETAKRSLEKTLSKETDKLETIRKKIVSTRQKNAKLDRTVAEMNVARWRMEYQRDLNRETRQREHADRQMRLFKQRSELIRRLQSNYAELLALQTEHELLRLRKRPTLEHFEILDDKNGS